MTFLLILVIAGVVLGCPAPPQFSDCTALSCASGTTIGNSCDLYRDGAIVGTIDCALHGIWNLAGRGPCTLRGTISVSGSQSYCGAVTARPDAVSTLVPSSGVIVDPTRIPSGSYVIYTCPLGNRLTSTCINGGWLPPLTSLACFSTESSPPVPVPFSSATCGSPLTSTSPLGVRFVVTSPSHLAGVTADTLGVGGAAPAAPFSVAASTSASYAPLASLRGRLPDGTVVQYYCLDGSAPVVPLGLAVAARCVAGQWTSEPPPCKASIQANTPAYVPLAALLPDIAAYVPVPRDAVAGGVWMGLAIGGTVAAACASVVCVMALVALAQWRRRTAHKRRGQRVDIEDDPDAAACAARARTGNARGERVVVVAEQEPSGARGSKGGTNEWMEDEANARTDVAASVPLSGRPVHLGDAGTAVRVAVVESDAPPPQPVSMLARFLGKRPPPPVDDGRASGGVVGFVSVADGHAGIQAPPRRQRVLHGTPCGPDACQTPVRRRRARPGAGPAARYPDAPAESAAPRDDYGEAEDDVDDHEGGYNYPYDDQDRPYIGGGGRDSSDDAPLSAPRATSRLSRLLRAVATPPWSPMVPASYAVHSDGVALRTRLVDRKGASSSSRATAVGVSPLSPPRLTLPVVPVERGRVGARAPPSSPHASRGARARARSGSRGRPQAAAAAATATAATGTPLSPGDGGAVTSADEWDDADGGSDRDGVAYGRGTPPRYSPRAADPAVYHEPTDGVPHGHPFESYRSRAGGMAAHASAAAAARRNRRERARALRAAPRWDEGVPCLTSLNGAAWAAERMGGGDGAAAPPGGAGGDDDDDAYGGGGRRDDDDDGGRRRWTPGPWTDRPRHEDYVDGDPHAADDDYRDVAAVLGAIHTPGAPPPWALPSRALRHPRSPDLTPYRRTIPAVDPSSIDTSGQWTGGATPTSTYLTWSPAPPPRAAQRELRAGGHVGRQRAVYRLPPYPVTAFDVEGSGSDDEWDLGSDRTDIGVGMPQR